MKKSIALLFTFLFTICDLYGQEMEYGDFIVMNSTDKDVSFDEETGILYVYNGSNVIIKNKNPKVPTNNSIRVYSKTVTLGGVNMNSNSQLPPIDFNSSSELTIKLMGGSENYLTGGLAVLSVPKGSTLTIDNIGDSNGSLSVLGTYFGIGSRRGGVGKVVINGGIVTAQGESGAGIDGSEGTIIINGGIVTAQGSYDGAGIGGNDARIYINGGSVTARGGNRAAGLGGGSRISSTQSYQVFIKAGTVMAIGGENAREAILGKRISIDGGTVIAEGGIRGGDTDITGGTVIANGRDGADGIAGDLMFSTYISEQSSAFVIANGGISEYSKEYQSNWKGVIIEDNVGQVYDNPILLTDAEISKETTVTVPEGSTWTIDRGVVLTNDGVIINNGTIINNGVIQGSGRIMGNHPIELSATISYDKNKNGWYDKDITLNAPADYLISLTIDGSYSESLIYSTEGDNILTYYLRLGDREPEKRTMQIKLDKSTPEVTVQTDRLNYTLIASDGKGSGIASVSIDGKVVDFDSYNGSYSANSAAGQHIYTVKDNVGHTIVGTFTLKEESDDVTDVEEIIDDKQVYTKDGVIYIQLKERERVTIISMSGVIICSEEQIGTCYYNLPRGFYTIRIGEKIFKVAN